MKKIVVLLFAALVTLTAPLLQASSILPPAQTQFLDANGNPLALGKVYFYIPNTLTPKDTYQDLDATILNTNPVDLDAGGRATIIGIGRYRQIVKDVLGNTIWDKTTSDLTASATQVVATLAALKALTASTLTDGQLFTITCYYTCTAPDGGGGTFKWYAADTTAGNDGSIVALNAGGTGRFRWIDPPSVINVHRFGAKGDNSTNDYAAINSAIASLGTTGGTIFGDSSKTYKVNTALVATGINNLTLRDLKLNMVGVANGADLLTVQGSAAATTTTLTVAGSKTNTSLTVVSSSGFAAGDMVQISSTERFANSDVNYVKGELGFVASIGGGTNITLTSGLKDSYSITGETVTVTRLNKILNPIIENVTITGNGAGATHVCARVNYAVNAVVRGLKASGCETTGVDFARVDNGVIEDSNVADATSTLTGYSYSFSNFTQNSRLMHSRATNFRHAFTTGSYNPVWNYEVSYNDFSHSLGVANAGAGALTHQNGIGGTYIGNRIDDVAYGIYLNSPRNNVVGNIVINAYGACYSAASADAVRETTISDNFCRGVRGIEGGTFTGSIGSAVLAIRGNTLYGEAVNGVSDDYGINVTTDNADITENKVDSFPTGVYTPGGTNLRIERNDILNFSTAIDLSVTTTPRVRQNTGYITENSGTGTIASGFTNVSVTHGLSKTPAAKDIVINFTESPTNDQGNWWISSVGATTFVLNVRNDPGASNLDFTWQAAIY